MTLILKLDLNIVMTYFCTKNEVNRSIGSKVINQKQTYRHRETDSQTDTCETFAYPLSQAVKCLQFCYYYADRIQTNATTQFIGGSSGGAPGARPPKGPNSFLLTYKIFEM